MRRTQQRQQFQAQRLVAAQLPSPARSNKCCPVRCVIWNGTRNSPAPRCGILRKLLHNSSYRINVWIFRLSSFVSPSPVIPHLFALSLESRGRCAKRHRYQPLKRSRQRVDVDRTSRSHTVHRLVRLRHRASVELLYKYSIGKNTKENEWTRQGWCVVCRVCHRWRAAWASTCTLHSAYVRVTLQHGCIYIEGRLFQECNYLGKLRNTTRSRVRS